MTWLPKFVVCLSYYDHFRFRFVSQQVPELLGIRSQIIADPVPRAALALVRYPAQIEPHAMILAFATLILIMACRRASRYIPTSLIALAIGALLVKFGHFPVPLSKRSSDQI